MYKKALIILALISIIFILAGLYMNYFSPAGNKDDGPREDLQVLVYSKSGCWYCIMAHELLKSRSINFENIDITNNVDLHLKLAKKTGRLTVPYVYINEEFIGGYAELSAIDKSGKLLLKPD